MTTLEHIKAGRDSGFSWCCIAFFLGRSFLMSKKWYKPKPKERKNAYNHVVCPLCRAFHWLFKTEIVYSYCRDCNWLQFKRIRCNKCNKMPYNPLERPKYTLDFSGPIGKFIFAGVARDMSKDWPMIKSSTEKEKRKSIKTNSC